MIITKYFYIFNYFNELLTQAKVIYNGAFSEKNFLARLVYFEDMTNFDIIPISTELTPKPEEVKQFFEALVKTYQI